MFEQLNLAWSAGGTLEMSAAAHGPHTTGVTGGAAASGSAAATPGSTAPTDPSTSTAAAAALPSARRLKPLVMTSPHLPDPVSPTGYVVQRHTDEGPPVGQLGGYRAMRSYPDGSLASSPMRSRLIGRSSLGNGSEVKPQRGS